MHDLNSIAKELDALDNEASNTDDLTRPALLGFRTAAEAFLDSALSALFPLLASGHQDNFSTISNLSSLSQNLEQVLRLQNAPVDICEKFISSDKIFRNFS